MTAVLEQARTVGFLGRGPISTHIDHAEAFGRALGSAECRFADIGAGGGVPSLPLLVAEVALQAVLIDSSQRRCSFLVWAATELGLDDRVEVWCGRAEEIAHEERARGRFDVVVARGFGPPSSTLECATPLARLGGRVVISEPPVPRRWPAEGLGRLGLHKIDGYDGVAVFETQAEPPPERPRPIKQQKRAPLLDIA